MALERLLKGFKDFRTGYFREHHDLFEKLATEGQSPKILIVGCADARVDPGILTQTKPGDIFTVRNVAAMVPPAQFPPDRLAAMIESTPLRRMGTADEVAKVVLFLASDLASFVTGTHIDVNGGIYTD